MLNSTNKREKEIVLFTKACRSTPWLSRAVQDCRVEMTVVLLSLLTQNQWMWLPSLNLPGHRIPVAPSEWSPFVLKKKCGLFLMSNLISHYSLVN